MTLQEKLNAYKARFKASAPPEMTAALGKRPLRTSVFLRHTEWL